MKFQRALPSRVVFVSTVSALALIAVACGPGSESATPTAFPEPTLNSVTPPENFQTPIPSPEVATDPLPETVFAETPISNSFEKPTETVDITFDGLEAIVARRFQSQYGWFTDFNQRIVDLSEISSLLPRDGIIPIDAPTFAKVSEVPDYLRAREPVVALEIDGDARAYPLAMLMWHEIANDVVGGVPVSVTFCPLCNTAITFDRTVNGQELTFGTSGNLRRSDLVMWDRQTESWWQQITGEAIVGVNAGAGTKLKIINSPIIAWETFAEEYPDGLVMERIFDELGFPIRSYDNPPYAGYDNVDNTPFAFSGEVDDRLVATSRILAVKSEGRTVAYPFSFLAETQIVNDRVGDSDVVVFFDDGTLSAFVDGRQGDQISGSTTMFNRIVDGQTLTFTLGADGIIDIETQSTWSLLGTAESGPLAGKKLEPVIHANHFWFAWAVFEPDTEIRDGADDISGPTGRP
ncbi:MAG: DUF3179 domain-containing protein [Chloroflexi bacterium]|nr:DUF3179 domain-containing protein [Chloroflexota bacterium]MBT7833490.1 DUF3179 domain-containing protein [Chloroflexota bacterium]